MDAGLNCKVMCKWISHIFPKKNQFAFTLQKVKKDWEKSTLVFSPAKSKRRNDVSWNVIQ